MAHMTVKTLLTSMLSLLLLSSCSQLKSLTAKDNSVNKTLSKKKQAKELVFLEDISVTPGQRVTSKHASIGPSAPKSQNLGEPRAGKREGGFNFPAIDKERGDWLQIKYASILNASPEHLTNTDLLQIIDEWWGTRYSLGGTTKDGIDCSAFVQVVMSGVFGVLLPRTSNEQFKASEPVDDEYLQEGDLVFFRSGRTISHVGIYLRNNKFVHASTSQGVMVSDLNETYWRAKFKSGGRVLSY